MTPPPDGDHEDYIGLIVDQVARRARTRMQFSGNKGLKLRSGGGCPKNHAIPDGTFAPLDLRLFRGADPWMPCEGVALVVEVTSIKPQADREAKRRCYARGGILRKAAPAPPALRLLPGDRGLRLSCRYGPVGWRIRQTSRPDGRVGILGSSRGTSGLHRAGWWLTATRGDPRDSATENRPPGTPVPGKGETVV